MDQLKKKIKAVDAYAKKYKKQLAPRPVLNQIKVIDGKGYFTDSHVAFYFDDIFPESVPLNNHTIEQVDGYYPTNIDYLIPTKGTFQTTEHKLSEVLDALKEDKKQGLWKDTMTTFCIYHVIDGKPIVGKNEDFHNVDPRRFYHVLNCLKKLGEKTIEVSLNLKKTAQPIVITGKETGVKVVFASIRVR
jgi:hypothetical protein